MPVASKMVGKCIFWFTFLLVRVSCEQKKSLTFVIDNTASMWDDIRAVRTAAKSIIDIVLYEKSSQIQDIVLVTFSDEEFFPPGVVFRKRTRIEEELKQAIDDIRLERGQKDCSESSLSGIKLGLEKSLPGSLLFVFTDASAKDKDKFVEVKELCQQKQIQIVFIITADCQDTYTDNYQVYHKIALASNGQVFRIEKDEVGQVIEWIKETIKGDKTVMTSTAVSCSQSYDSYVYFNIDEKTEYALVSAAGFDVSLNIEKDVRTFLVIPAKRITWTSNVKALKLVSLTPGRYRAVVRGSSDVNVMVFGRTDFNFELGFSNIAKSSLEATETQPTIGTESHLIISVKDDENSVNIQNVEILDMQENVIKTLPLTHVGGNVYTTEKFMSPNTMFKVAVNATARSTGQPILCIANTPVEPVKPVVVAPEILDSEKNVKTAEGSVVNIECRIQNGVPRPQMTWYFKQRGATEFTLMKNMTDEILRVSNATERDAGDYKCVAENIAGRKDNVIQLEVNSPARIVTTPRFYKGVEGDVVMKVPCTAVGYPKPKVTWVVDQTVVEIDKSKNMYVEDGVLYLMNPNETDSSNHAHTYVCHAVNAFGKVEQSYEVIISKYADYEEPEEKYSEIGKPYDLHCPLQYTDPDSVRWFVDTKPVNRTGPYIHFDKPNLANDGNYTCRVSDLAGAASYTVQLKFGYPPWASSLVHDEEWDGEESEITCKTTQIPLEGKYEWFYRGQKIKESHAQQSEVSVTGWGQYVCRVTNTLGSLNITYNVHAEDCIIERSLSKTKNLPILLDGSSTWPTLARKRQYQIIPKFEKITLICQDESPQTKSKTQSNINSFTKFPNTKSLTATCDHQDLFLVEGVSHKFSELVCKEEVPSRVIRTEECLGSGTIMAKVGFNVNGFLDVYKYCLDTKRNVVLYTEVTTTGADSMGYTDVPEGSCRTVAGCCYESVQFVSAADVIAGPAEKATLREPLNSVSYCRPSNENTMSWHDIEKQVRRTSSWARLVVWSGAVNYTTVDKLQVPKYLWKVVKDLDSEEIVAIVHSNEPTPDANVCESVCHDSSWFEPYGASTYCCRLEEFKRVFNLSIHF